MKKSIDKRRKRADIPTVSKPDFIAEYVGVVRIEFPSLDFTVFHAGDTINAVIRGRQGPSTLLNKLAKQHGAQRGRVGNFLRGLR